MNPLITIINGDPTLYVNLDNLLIDFLKKLKLLSFKVEFIQNNEKKRILNVGDKLSKYIPKEKVFIFNIPQKIPMITPP